MTGRFITLEGGEGVGKSTQAKMLVAALERRGIACTLTREPGGTDGAEAIRRLLLDGDGFGARAEALLFAAARADHVERLIRPALDRGEWVICDRFLDSSRAYQGGAGELGDEAILALHAIGSAGLLPDRTLLFELAPDDAQGRVDARDGGESDAIGSRGHDYHAAVASAFAAMASTEPQRFATIAADGTPDDVHRRVVASLAEFLDGTPSC